MSDARTRLERADHGVLSTLHPARGVDSVPVCFVVDGDLIVIPIDTIKPKRSTRLGRLRNLEADPRATLLVEHWDFDDWSTLWWVRASLVLTDVDTPIRPWTSTRGHSPRSTPQYAGGGIKSVIPLRIVDLVSWSASD